MRVKEESEKAGLKLNIQKMKIVASGPFTSWKIDWEKPEMVTDFIFLGFKVTADSDCSHEIKDAFSLEGKWKLISCVRLFVTPWAIQFMEFSRPEYWSRQPFPSPGDLPNPGVKLSSPALQADSSPA